MEVGLEPHPLQRPSVHRVIEHLITSLAGTLRLVHGDVGVSQQLLGAAVVGTPEGDADAGVGEDFVPRHRERALQRIEHSPSRRTGSL